MADLSAFNAAPARQAERYLRDACDSRVFAAAVGAGRPYPDADALLAAADTAVEAMSWDDVLEAMRGHSRIGDRPTQRESHAEQSGVTDADRAELTEGNAAYEQRFGHIYLVCATGLTGRDMLADLHRRLANDQIAERGVARRELKNITRLRLRKLLTP